MKPLILFLILSACLILPLSIATPAKGETGSPHIAVVQSSPSLAPSGTFNAPRAPELQNNNSNQSNSSTPTPTPIPAVTPRLDTSSSSSPSVTEPTTGSWWPWIIIAVLVLVVVFLVGRRSRNK